MSRWQPIEGRSCGRSKGVGPSGCLQRPTGNRRRPWRQRSRRLLGGSGVSREAPAPFCERPERFDKNRSALFEIQDQIVARLPRAAGLQVIDVEARRSERSASPTAIDFVMRGQAMINGPASRETIISARDLFQRALEYVSNNPDALAGVAMTYVFEVLNGYYAGGRDERLRNAEALIQRALTADPGHLTALKV